MITRVTQAYNHSNVFMVDFGHTPPHVHYHDGVMLRKRFGLNEIIPSGFSEDCELSKKTKIVMKKEMVIGLIRKDEYSVLIIKTPGGQRLAFLEIQNIPHHTLEEQFLKMHELPLLQWAGRSILTNGLIEPDFVRAQYEARTDRIKGIRPPPDRPVGEVIEFSAGKTAVPANG